MAASTTGAGKAARTPNCGTTGHTVKGGYTRTRFGKQKTVGGLKQRWQCKGPDGTTHLFTTILESDMTGRSKRGESVRKHEMSCPKLAHADGRVRYKGERDVEKGHPEKGKWKRWQCVPRTGKAHYFQTLDGTDPRLVTTIDQMPPCPKHGKDTDVVRNGSIITRDKAGNGVPGSVRRQRYRCDPGSGDIHYFTTALPRGVVTDRMSTCPVCDDILTPHQGAMSGARATRMTLTSITQALGDLALGQSYASVSMDIRSRRAEMKAHLASHQQDAPAVLSDGIPESSARSWTATEGKSAWRLAADLVEQYSPMFFNPTIQAVRERETRQRVINDQVLAGNPDAALAAPIVYLLDEQEVTVYRRSKAATTHQRGTWAALVVVELVWHPTKRDVDGFPGDWALPDREARLRLVRAYPAKSELAWKLVLDELGTRPDVVISDCGSGILNAVANTYGNEVAHIPSMYHIHENLRRTLLRSPRAGMEEDGHTVLIPVLGKHMDALRREDALNLGVSDWKDWWDELDRLGAAFGVPLASLREQRKLYENRVTAAFPLIRRQPQLPASNASVEAQIRLTLDPFIGPGRAHRYRNLARTNMLLDLAVCRAQGAFTDITNISQTIRDDNEANRGWAPRPRMIIDIQPAAPTTTGTTQEAATPEGRTRKGGGPQAYSSLLNPFLLPAIAERRAKEKAAAVVGGGEA